MEILPHKESHWFKALKEDRSRFKNEIDPVSRRSEYWRKSNLEILESDLDLNTLPKDSQADSVSIELNRADDRLLIIGDTIKESQVDDIRKFIENGHSVLLALKSESMSRSLTALAKSGPVPLTEARVDKYALLSQLDFEHPLLAPFHEPRFSDFTKIHFWKHRSLDPARLPGAKILARFDNGDPALMDLRIGRGHLFIWISRGRCAPALRDSRSILG